MNWWYTPFARVDLANGGVVKLIIIAIIWMGAAVIVGAGIGRLLEMKIRPHWRILWTALSGIVIGLVIGFAAGCIYGM